MEMGILISPDCVAIMREFIKTYPIRWTCAYFRPSQLSGLRLAELRHT
jgi:hypothetical protein